MLFMLTLTEHEVGTSQNIEITGTSICIKHGYLWVNVCWALRELCIVSIVNMIGEQ